MGSNPSPHQTGGLVFQHKHLTLCNVHLLLVYFLTSILESVYDKTAVFSCLMSHVDYHFHAFKVSFVSNLHGHLIHSPCSLLCLLIYRNPCPICRLRSIRNNALIHNVIRICTVQYVGCKYGRIRQGALGFKECSRRM